MKRKMVFLFLVLFVISTFSCFAQSSSNDQRIVGTWIHTGDNNITMTLVFNANGSGSVVYSDWSEGNENLTYGISSSGVINIRANQNWTREQFSGATLFFSPDGRTLIINNRIFRKR